MDSFLALVVYAVASGMFTQYALLTPNKYASGPFRRKDKTVSLWDPITETTHERPYGLFDDIRRLLRAPYIADEDHKNFFVGPDTKAWSCVFCLSFYTSSLFSIPYCLLYNTLFDLFSIQLFIMFGTIVVDKLLEIQWDALFVNNVQQ